MNVKSIALLSVTFLVACAMTATLATLRDPQKRRMCPYGHTYLKTVDLIHVGPHRPLTDEERARIAKHEAFISPDSGMHPLYFPKTTVYCERCGFVLLEKWTRKAKD